MSGVGPRLPCITTCWVSMVATVAKAVETFKFWRINPPRNVLRHQSQFKTKEGVGFIPHVGVKPIPKGNAATTGANHVLSLLLTISTRRVEQITSKATVSDEALVLIKSRFEREAKNPRI